MSLFDKKLSDVTEGDLIALVEGLIAESRIIDYKLETAGKSDSQRQEFLADVTSFANAIGGHLVLGVKEEAGLPIDITGLDCENPDGEILRLEQIIRTGSRPVLQGIESVAVPLSNSRFVIIMRISRSWNGPHQVGQTGSYRFFGRGSNGKFALDVDALRQLFRQGPELSERISSFRTKRVLAIESADLPVTLEGSSQIICHIVPLTNFATGELLDLTSLLPNATLLRGLLEHGASTRFNLDGAIAVTEFSEGLVREYAQLYRNGTIEFVSHWPAWEVDGNRYLPGTAFDEEILRLFAAVRDLYGELGVTGVTASAITLLGMKGWRMGAGRSQRQHQHFFDRDQVLCPETLIETLDGNIKSILKPLLDIAWNASGFDRSMNYDEKGNWRTIRN